MDTHYDITYFWLLSSSVCAKVLGVTLSEGFLILQTS